MRLSPLRVIIGNNSAFFISQLVAELATRVTILVNKIAKQCKHG